MARYRGPRLKIIRRLGTPLPGLMRTDPDLRRPYGPGQHGPTKRAKLSDYALRLREKQKVRFHYGLSEKQFQRYVAKAFGSKGNPGLTLLTSLERRLDSVLFRAGFAPTISAARQMARHGHVSVNGRRVDIPSYSLQVGDVIAPGENSKMKEAIQQNRQDPNNLAIPPYLTSIESSDQFKVAMVPAREDIPVIVNEQLIVEYYSGK
ncbi:MAG: 30S ribosomal protein S4 [Myxococcaceae bacterium]|nr:30S ribosomal protein S4 [Myxococcaceae bacterium]MBH2006280.1 30S ribosomal protein S4 [Myxococcaceae bacterium]